MRTLMMASQALDEASRWLTGQMPQIARGDGRHLVVRAALGELLEPAHLGDVQLRSRHLPAIIKLNRNFRVPLDAGYGVNRDLLHRNSLGHG